MGFDRQPTLHGSKLSLRPLQASDHDAFVAAANDRESYVEVEGLIFDHEVSRDAWQGQG